MKPMHLINSRCHYCSWCELLPPRFAVDQGYTAILVCSPIHSSSSLGGRKIDGNINGNMNESNLQAPAASFWCMYTLKKGELEVTEDRREIYVTVSWGSDLLLCIWLSSRSSFIRLMCYMYQCIPISIYLQNKEYLKLW